jgi:hypothetical protein
MLLRTFLKTSIAHSGKDETIITKNQSKTPNASVLNTPCKKGTYTTAICSKNDMPVARISFLFVNTPILNRDSVKLRQLKE